MKTIPSKEPIVYVGDMDSDLENLARACGKFLRLAEAEEKVDEDWHNQWRDLAEDALNEFGLVFNDDTARYMHSFIQEVFYER